MKPPAQSSSSLLPSILVGLSSGIGYAMAHRLIHGRDNKEDGSASASVSNATPTRFNLKPILSKIKRRSNRIDWSTVLILYILAQLRGRQASIAMPFLYLILKDNGDGDDNDGGNDYEDSNNIHHDHLENDEHENNAEVGNEVQIESPNAIVFHDASTSTSALPINPSMISQRQSERLGRSRSNSILTQNSETSTASVPNQRYVEMLVHNVSHTDMVLSLGIPDESKHKNMDSNTNLDGNAKSPGSHLKSEAAHALCRPRFSAFDMFCRRILSVFRSCLDIEEGLDQHQQEEQKAKIQQLLSYMISFPRYERSDITPRFSLVTPKRQVLLPVGFNLSQLVEENKEKIRTNEEKNLDLSSEDMNSLRVRGKDLAKIEGFTGSTNVPFISTPKRKNGESDNVSSEESNDTSKPLYMDAIFFPLLSSLLRRWNAQISDKYGSTGKMNVKKVLILVSGVGTPRNWTHSMTGNSTETISELMEFFIKVLYPDVVVVRLHSQREIFRCDENITFATKELLPCVNAYRDAHARGERYPDEVADNDWATTATSTNSFDPDWKQSFSVTLSFADGAAARTHAIQSSLRSYRPTYFHFWQLKTFWHDNKICDDDIEVHSFESMETAPAMEVQKTGSDVQMVVDEMKRFRQSFIKNLEGDNDIKNFWLRKTRKPVLAVLLVNRPGKGLIMYTGMNMEVSMPTGSLCAERNVIGTALASDQSLRRQDLLMVAVLAVTLPNESTLLASPPQLPSPPPGTNANECTVIDAKEQSRTRDTSTFFSEVEEKLSRYQRPENMRRSLSIGSFASIVEGSDSHETDESWEQMSSNEKVPESPPPVIGKKGLFTTQPIPEVIAETASTASTAAFDPPSGVSTPVRKIKLYAGGETGNDKHQKSKSGIFRRKKKRTVIVQSPDDINPLKPCGACNEWLKKIAESNPYFKVITFTDVDCSGVYVTPCQE